MIAYVWLCFFPVPFWVTVSFFFGRYIKDVQCLGAITFCLDMFGHKWRIRMPPDLGFSHHPQFARGEPSAPDCSYLSVECKVLAVISTRIPPAKSVKVISYEFPKLWEAFCLFITSMLLSCLVPYAVAKQIGIARPQTCGGQACWARD